MPSYNCLLQYVPNVYHTFVLVLYTVPLTLPPVIAIHPSSQYIMSCSNNVNISLSCQADRDLSYVWERQNGNISFGAIGVNTNTLTLTDAQPDDSGNYRCVAANTCGITYSDYANITISGKMDIKLPLIILCAYSCLSFYIAIDVQIIFMQFCGFMNPNIYAILVRFACVLPTNKFFAIFSENKFLGFELIQLNQIWYIRTRKTNGMYSIYDEPR